MNTARRASRSAAAVPLVRDYTAAERAARYRAKKRDDALANQVRLVTASHPNVTASHPNVTQAEAEAEAEKKAGLPACLPPADRTERTLHLQTEALRTKLYAQIDRMVRSDPKHRDATELMRLVTGYEKPDGTVVKGAVNAALLSYERLEKSIEDAAWHLGEWKRESTKT